MRKFGLELHPDKTRLIEFGRYAARHRKQRGERKPETFDFLGFTHLCGKTSKKGHFMVLRKTARKRMRAKLQQISSYFSPASMIRLSRLASGSVRSFKATSTTMRFLVTGAAWESFEHRWNATGGWRYGVAARRAV